MFKEVLGQVDVMFDVIIEGTLPEKIAKVSRKMYKEFMDHGFTREESIQFITAILGKKS
jgi:NADH:ubiquinone oxidoreductase subunit B-like Fe-S oxidoreductase